MGGNVDLKDLKNFVQPTVTVPEQNWAGVQQNPSVCPGCGRCKECGQPVAQPLFPYTYPYSPTYTPLPSGGIVWMSNTNAVLGGERVTLTGFRSGQMKLVNKGTQGE